jgi:hypothetical protein
MLVVSEDLVLGAGVQRRQGIDSLQNLLQRLSCTAISARVPDPFQTFRQRPLYRFSDGLTSLLGDQSGQSLGLFVLDTKSQNASEIEL